MHDLFHIGDAELRRMLPLLTHDLRNPLAAIVTNLEYSRRSLARTQPHSEVGEAVDDSVAACDLLRRMLANLDVLIRGDTLKPTLAEVDLVAAVRDAVRRNKVHAVQAGLTLEVRCDTEQARALLDKELVALTLDNLLTNSVQHAPRGSRIEMAIAFVTGGVAIIVSDTGPAIPIAVREHALSPAAHTHEGRTPDTRYSRGLGLLAARAAAAANGSTLQIDGDEQGSRMTVTFALQE